MICARLAIIVLTTGLLGGCATTTGSPGSADSSGIFSLFDTRGSTLRKLVSDNKLTEADEYFGKERAFFHANVIDNQPTLQKLSSGLAAKWTNQLDVATARLEASRVATPQTWPEAKASLAEAEAVYMAVNKVEIFKEPGFEINAIMVLGATLAETKKTWKDESLGAFKKHDHLSGKSFLTSYPLDVNEGSFLDTNYDLIRSLINTYNTDQLAGFAKTYSAPLSHSAPLNDLLAGRFMTSFFEASQKPLTLVSIINGVNRAKVAGFTPKSVPGIKIGFAEVTSKSLTKDGGVEFPAQVTMDLPFEPSKTDIDALMIEGDPASPDILIVFDVAKASTSRRILGKTEEASQFVSGSRTEPNPAYEIARGKLYEARSGLANAQGTYAQGIAGAIIKGIAVGVWRSNVTTAESALTSTPPSLTVDLQSDYKYSSSEVKANRVMSTNYYVIDRAAKRYYKGVFDTTETKTFKISYDVNDKDTQRQRILSQFDKEDDIVRFEQAPMTIAASALIADYLNNAAASKPLPTIVKLRQEMLEDKNKALTDFKSKQFDGKPLKDSRFDSVVVVLNPKGVLGSGFFVKPTLVLTNYHVIEGVKFVEMKMFNGMETFGKVVKSDVRLDLALIKVQDAGVPVQFFEGNTLDLGSTLEAIGHPKGLTFTITRGVASSVRPKKSVYAVGGKDVLFVQTDAAINPGNSGGPLFLGQKVVGVNNNKLAGGSEGLGFAVHYSEVAEFMKDSF